MNPSIQIQEGAGVTEILGLFTIPIVMIDSVLGQEILQVCPDKTTGSGNTYFYIQATRLVHDAPTGFFLRILSTNSLVLPISIFRKKIFRPQASLFPHFTLNFQVLNQMLQGICQLLFIPRRNE
jgi:hypothetical protein